MDPQSNLPKLLALAAEGDRHAFGEFYALHLNEIYRYVLFRVNEYQEAEDLTAKVFLEAWESLTGARRESKIMNHRTRKPHEPLEGNPDKKLQAAGLEGEVDHLFISRELARGVRQLPENYQEVIILRFINRMSHADVAEVMNVTTSHVRVLQYRALKQMREIISEEIHE
jgi:RNA polymerase sigma-70 factor (ECF subfamily)